MPRLQTMQKARFRHCQYAICTKKKKILCIFCRMHNFCIDFFRRREYNGERNHDRKKQKTHTTHRRYQMTDKQLRKLRRAELLEMMFYIQKELDELKAENESLKQKLEQVEGGLSETALQQITDAVKSAIAEAAIHSNQARGSQHEQ